MKKWLIFISIVVLITVFLIVYSNWTMPIKEFNIDDYSYYVENFPFSYYTETLPEIPEYKRKPIYTEKEAVAFARRMWKTYYDGAPCLGPFHVWFDSANSVWYIHSSSPPFLLGGLADIIIYGETGEIIAMWYEK